jgi:hypothetical protein
LQARIHACADYESFAGISIGFNSKNGYLGVAMIETQVEFSKDLLRGAAAISEFLYGDPGHRRKVYYLWATSRAPFFKIGSMICARKSVLLGWITDQERRRCGEDFSLAKDATLARA